MRQAPSRLSPEVRRYNTRPSPRHRASARASAAPRRWGARERSRAHANLRLRSGRTSPPSSPPATVPSLRGARARGPGDRRRALVWRGSTPPSRRARAPSSVRRRARPSALRRSSRVAQPPRRPHRRRRRRRGRRRAHWRVDHDADAVTLAGDVLILTVRAPVDAHSDVNRSAPSYSPSRNPPTPARRDAIPRDRTVAGEDERPTPTITSTTTTEPTKSASSPPPPLHVLAVERVRREDRGGLRGVETHPPPFPSSKTCCGPSSHRHVLHRRDGKRRGLPR